jgi:VCBS repeat-containing protein
MTGRKSSRLLLEQLENRLMFDGVTVIPEAPDASTMTPEADMADAEMASLTSEDSPTTDMHHELLFVDPSAEGLQERLDLLAAATPDSSLVELLALSPEQDLFAQISDRLQGQSDLSSIGLILNADGGQLRLGVQPISADLLTQHASEIALWSNALQSDATIILHGNIAQQAELDRLAESLEALTQRTTIVDIPETVAAGTETATRTEIVFVDRNFENADELIQSIGAHAEVIILEPGQDGIQQMAAILASRTDVDAIHIISHGGEGTLKLGTGDLNMGTMRLQYAAALRTIGASLASDGDIMVYGCDFGRGAIGSQSVQLLAEITGADVAASMNLTGSTDLNGDWNLERTAGSIETSVVITRNGQQMWQGVLSNIVTPFASRFSTTDYGDITMAANTVMWAGSAANSGGTGNNNSFSMINLDVDADGSTFNSSSSNLELPSGSNVLFAGLYWGGRSSNAARNVMSLKFAGDSSYTTITGSVIGASGVIYGAFADVTAQVQAKGAGTYWGGNVQTTNGSDQYGGWSLVVAYRDPAATAKNLTVFDGFAVVNTTAPTTITIPVTGFQAPPSGPVNAKVAAVVYEGDRGTTGDFLQLNGTNLSDAANPSNNFFNSSISRLGVDQSTITPSPKNPNFINQLGFDADIVAVPTGVIANGATSATLTMGTTGDFYYPSMFATAIDVYAPQITAVKTGVDVNGGGLVAGDEIEYTIVVSNNGGDGASEFVLNDNIPTWTNYVPGSLQITSGANSGAKTDVSIDDQAEYNSGTDRVTFRLGTGANGLTGGLLGIGDSTTIKFRVVVESGVPAGTLITNQANLSFKAFSLNMNLTSSTTAASSTVNSPPTTTNDAVTINEDTTVVLAITDFGTYSDPNGDALAAIRITTLPSAGSLQFFNGTSWVAVTTNQVITAASITSGNLRFTPVLNQNGSPYTTIGFQANDGSSYSGTQTLTVNVTPVNDPPVAVNDTFITDENIPVSVTVKANDSDVEGNTLTITQVNGTNITAGGAAVTVTNGTVSLNAAGTQLTINPTSGYNGPASFTYAISDGNGGTATATVSGTVRPVNDPPIAVNDSFGTINEDTSATISVLTNDTDQDGNPLSITHVSGTAITAGGPAVAVTNGTVSLNPAGTQLTFVPTANFNGAVSFSYTISDGNGGTASAAVTGTVATVNDPPVAVNDSFTTNEDTSVGITVKSNDSDVDGNPLTITQVNGTAITAGGAAVAVTNGTVSLNAAGTLLTFTPAANYNGPASFTYTISDGNGGTASATVSGTVTAVNDPPVAVNDSFGTINEDTSAAVTVKTNDNDVDGNPLTITQVNGTAIVAGGASVTVTNGTVALSADGNTLTFTPNANYNGPASYTYTISDGAGGTASATVSGTVTAVNDAPVNTLPASSTTNEDTSVPLSGLSIADVDAASGNMTVTLSVGSGSIAATAGGGVTVSGSGSGSITLTGTLANLNSFLLGSAPVYSPASNFNGSVTLTMLTSDLGNTGTGGTLTDSDTRTITVNAVNDPPVAVNDSFTTNEDTPVATTVLANDSDVDGNPLTVTQVNGSAIVAGGAAVAVTNGTVSLNAAGTQLTFTPAANYNGAASYTYTISDGQGGTATATVSGTVNAVNDPPVAVNDSFTTNEDTSVGITVKSNDSDIDGNPLTITQVNGTAIVAGGASVTVTNGTVSLNAAGTLLTFTPAANYNGPASFTYTISDGAGGTASATVSGTVNAVNDPPVAVADSFGTINEDTSATVTVKSNDSDVDGNPLTITQVNGTAIVAGGASVTVTNGTVALSADGNTLTFMPSANYNGPASYTYTISDGQGGTATATVSGTVAAVNDAPDAIDDSFTTNEDTSVSISVKSNDTDIEGNPLTVTHVNGTAITAGGAAVAVTNGTVSLNAAGTQLSFTPSLNYNGPASFTYTVNDGAGGTDTATVSGTVMAINDPPVAMNDSFTTNEDTAVTLLALTNDSDIDGNPLSITQVNGAAIIAGGAAVPVTNGTVSLNAAATQLTFTPAANYNGLASFTYTISDGAGGTATATISGTVNAVNDPPVAANDSFSTAEDTAVTISVKANDTDVDGNPLTITQVNGLAITAGGAAVAVTNGTVSLNAAGTQLIFTPATNYNGPASFTYTISDGAGGTATANVSGSVGGVNDLPAAVADTNTTTENANATGNVLTNDSDLDGDTLTVSMVNGAAGNVGAATTGTNGGSFTIQSNGSYVFNPGTAFDDVAVGQTRSTSVTYEVSDGNGGTASTTVTVTVTGTNDAPISTAIATQNNSDSQAVTLDVSSSFSDPDGSDVLSFSATNLPPGLSIHPTTGVITGTIAANASVSGPYSVTITGTDPSGVATSQTFTWNVANPAPTANDDSGSTTENATATGNVRTNDTDPDGDTLTVSAVNGVAGNVGTSVTGSNGGSFTISSTGTYTFNPGTAFDDLAVGETRTTTVSYTISDGQGGTDTAVVTMTVTGTNDAPTSTPIAAQNSTDSASVTLNVSGNFSDPDASTSLTFSATNLPAGLSINPTTGIVTGTIAANASVTGPYSVTITGTDPSGVATSQTFTWTVTNPAPTAINDSGSTTENASTSGNVGTNDTDPDGDALNVSAVNGAAGSVGSNITGSTGGTFNISSTGAYTFAQGAAFDDLALGETRVTTVSYTISDGQGGTSTATLSVTVTGTNDAPTSTPIAAQTNNDSAVVTLDVSSSFADADGSDTFTFSASNLPPGLSIHPTTGVITGTIAASASVGGPYSVTITGTDPNGAATAQTFVWTVTNPAPTANANTNSTTENATASGNVITNDTDPDGDTLTVGAVNGVAGNVGASVVGSNGGSFTVNTNGGYSFNPGTAFDDLAVGETRTTSVTYTATDSQGGTSTTTLTITVTGTNDAPTSGAISAQNSTDSQVVSLNVSGNFNDPDGSDTLTYSEFNLPPGLSIHPTTGVISGTIDNSASVTGPYSVTITATDPYGATTSQTFTWNVTNPGPSATADTGSASENGSTTGNVLTNDSDPDGDTLTVSAVNGVAGNVGTAVTGTSGGSFTINANGGYTFNSGTAFDDLALGETRTTTVTYTNSDSEGGTATTTLTVTVTGTNDGPVSTVIPDASHTDSEVVNLNISSYFSDPDTSDALTFSGTNLPPGLSLDLNTGLISGTLDADASTGGPYSVTITATDPHGGTTVQTFSWVVTNVPPTAYDDFDGTTENSLVTGNVLANDVDPDNDPLIVAAVNGSTMDVAASIAGTHGGAFTIQSDGSYTFIPGVDFDDLAVGETRSTSIRYTADDGNGGAVEATLTVVITGTNDAPTSNPIATQSGVDDQVVSLDVSGNFSDPDATDVFAFTSTGLPAGLSIDSVTGVITGVIDPSASASGPYTVTVTATDPSGATTSQTFTWTVTNPGPTAVANSFSTAENSITTGNVLTDDTDPDGDTLVVSAVNGVAGNVGTAVTGTSGGAFTIGTGGAMSFDPGTAFDDLAVGETRTTSVTYTISDNEGGTSTATVLVTVTGVNDAPASTIISTQSGSDAGSVTLDVSGNFSDPDGSDVLSFGDGGTLPPGLSIDPNTGVITGTIDPSASVSGPYTVVITATDPSGVTTSQTFVWNVINPAPTAVADTGTVAAGSTTTGNVISNDTDPDGDTLTVAEVNGVAGNVGASVTGSNGGAFTITSTGGYTFDPGTAFDDLAAGETRVTTVSYTMTDNEGGSSTTTLSITVTGANEAPTSTPIATQSGTDNVPVTLDVSGNFTDGDASDVLTFSDGGTLPPGLSIDPATGVITGTIDPSASIGGPYTVTITATDPWGATTSQIFTWNVANPAPTAVDDNFTTTENATASGNVLTHGTVDSDPDGDTLTVSAVNGVAGNVGASVTGSNGGTFTVGSTGAMTFNPGTAFNDLAVGETRTTSVTYTVSDGEGGTDTATVTYTVTGTNDAPTSTGIATQNSSDSGSVSLNVSGNFSDPDGSDVLVFNDGGTLPPGLSIDPNTGLITGTIDPSASVGGPYTVTITATDPSGAQTSQTFTWNVTNPAPVANNDSAAITENASTGGNVLTTGAGADTDPDGDALIVTQVDGVSVVAGPTGTAVIGSNGGTFVVSHDGTWTFNPGMAFDNLAVGETRVSTVTYTISDGEGGTDTATITVTVTGTNDAPVSTPIATQTGTDNTPVTLDVSGNFSDPDGSDALTFGDGGTLPPGLSIDPTTGVITGVIDPSASASGPYTVTVTATDPSGATTSQTFTWTVTNPGPTAVANSFSTAENSITTGNVLTDDTDPDGDTLVVSAVNGVAGNVGTAVTGTSGGAFTIGTGGAMSFDPGTAFDDLAVGETRTTSVTYTISDNEGGTSTATVLVTVTGVNDAPASTIISTQSGSDAGSVTLDVSGNFSDPDGSDVLSFGDGGTLPPGLSIDPNTGVITGTIDPSASVSGPYTVVITATDPSGVTTSQTFVWNVINPAPTAVADTGTVAAGSTTTGNVISNDTDPDGDTLTVAEVNGVAGNVGASVTGSNGGAFTITSTGGYTFDPGTAFDDLAAGETRVTTVSYTMTDNEGGSSTTTLSITVTGANEAPTSTPIATQSGTDNVPVTLDVSGNFTDGDASDVLTFSDGGTLPPGLSIDPATGVITGTIDPSASIGGPYTVTITATDPWGATTSQIFTWNVANPAPTAVDDNFTTTENATASGNVLTHGTVDSDPDGDTLTVSAVNGVAGNVGASVTGSNGGTFTVGSTGAMTFNPGTAFNDLAVGETRTTSVTYTVSDGEGGTDTATVTYTVTGTNDAPTSTTIAAQTGVDNAPISFDVSGNFADPDASDVFSFTATNLPPGLSIDPLTGVISGTIDPSASTGGPYSVTVTATDPSGVPTSQTFIWNVTNPAPTAANDGLAVTENASTTVNVLDNDTDPDGDALIVTHIDGVAVVAGPVGTAVTGSNGGTFAIAQDGTLSFNPGTAFDDLAVGETRTTTVTYTISDGEGGTSTATVTVTVTGTNDAPFVAAPIPAQLSYGAQTVSLDVSSGFGDPDSTNVLTFSASSLPLGLTIDPLSGIVTGTVDPSAVTGGPYTVSITATDPSGARVTQTFIWTVASPDLSITVDDNNVTVQPDGVVIYTLDYANHSSAPASGIVITQEIPPQTTFDSANSSPGWTNNGDETWSLTVPNLAAWGQGSVQFAVKLDPEVAAGLEAIATAGTIQDDGTHGVDLVPGNNSGIEDTPVEAQPDYSVTISSSNNFPRPGESLTWTVNVVNQGNQEGTGVTVTSVFPIELLQNIVPSHGGIVNLATGTITWNLGNLPAGEAIALTVSARVVTNPPGSIVAFTHLTSVTDDGLNGPDPQLADNSATLSGRVLNLAYDSFNSAKDDRVAFNPAGLPPLTTRVIPMSSDPIFSGITEPGATLVGRIYDEHGNLIGERQVMADSSGNWMMAFPNAVVMEQPHQMEIRQTSAIQSLGHEGGFNLRRYYHPAAVASIFFTEDYSISSVFRRSAYEMVEAAHEGTINPFGFNWFAHAYELNSASTNAGQG